MNTPTNCGTLLRPHSFILMKNSLSPYLLICCLLLSGCASIVWDELTLMPPPDVYRDGMLNPLPETDPFDSIPYQGVLYATNRKPASTTDSENYYLNERGGLLRLGVAKVSMISADLDWDEIQKVSLLTDRTQDYPLRVTNVEEFGVLEETIPKIMKREELPADVLDGDEEFSDAINAQLARSKRKDIYIFTHGYKVVFENPVLVASELWHFLGYDGVMIAYAWPSTPSKWAYLKDTDTSNGYARDFRKFLEYLGDQTDAEEIHVIGYSAGTRMVARAYEQLALMHHDENHEEIQEQLRLGHLILVGSDLDRAVFGEYLADGVLKVPRHMAVYVSDKDKALGFSRWLTRRERLGQTLSEESLRPSQRRLLTQYSDHISLIDVSDAEGADTGNGHGYFRTSPWASSDILMTLMYDLTPEQRGLILKQNMPVWEFPGDYLTRLWATLEKKDEDFRDAYQAHQNP